MTGNDLIEYIKQRPQLLSVDIKFTIMSLINDRLINPSALIDAQYAIKDNAEITANVPILVKDVIWGELFVIDKNNMADWSGALLLHPNQYKWRKIHE